jgi:hypothetical protein
LIRFILIVLLALSCIISGSTSSAAPALSAEVNIGGATTEPASFTVGNSYTETCPMAQLKLKVKNILGPITFNGEVRHAFCDSDKRELSGKSRYCAGVELPVGGNTALFCNYERAYRTNDDWAWAGVSFRFGP